MGSSEQFAHLHVHTEYSMLDGAARVKDLFAEAARMGMPALATTDHGNMFGAYEFWKQGKAHGVKPIIGIEGYLTPGTARSDRTRIKWGSSATSSGDDVSGAGAYTHLTLLAETTAGMHNLFRLSSLASLEGFFYKPRMDRELLSRYASGLIATTGCPSGEVQTRLRLGQYEQARAAAAEFRDIFGRDNYFLELMDHGLGIQSRVRADLLRLADDLQLPLLATNDLHYTHKEDAQAHAVLLCVQSGSTLADPNRFKFDADEFYLKSAQEMRQLWAELPMACDNTLAIAERCDVTFNESTGAYMPRFGCPPGESEQSWFVKEVEAGLRGCYPAGVPHDVRVRAEYETEVIAEKGYCFPPGTPVLMGNGTFLPIEDVSEGDLVTSFSAISLETTKGLVEKPLQRDVDEDLIVIQPYGQPLPIEVTDEHPCLELTKGWVRAGELRQGDSLLLPQAPRAAYAPFDLMALACARGWTVHQDGNRFVRLRLSEHRIPRSTKGSMPTKVEWSPDLMWLLGLWVAEGHLYDLDSATNPGQIGWTLHRDEPAVQQLLETISRLRLGRARVYSKARSQEPEHQGVVVMLTNHPLALFISAMLGTGVRTKQIQPWVTSVPEEGMRSFVAGWHEGDGHDLASGRMGVSTVNVNLARQLRSILLSLGHWATITSQTTVRDTERYKVTWHPSPHKAPYGARCVDGSWWVRIRSVDRKHYEGTVYNLTVSGHHTYVADSIAVHNCGYFLVVADFINWAKANGIRVGPGRGSGAGAMTAYAMGITDLDPLQHGLVFERFINPERMSMPDFDVDFDERRRGEVIRYVTQKYGDDRVAQIVTYGTIKAKQAVKDASRVLGYPFSMGDRITKAMPPSVMGKDVPLSGIFDPEHKRYTEAAEFRQLYSSDPEVAKVVDTAKGLENLKRQWGVHAAGVIMSSEPLLGLIPIMRREQDGQILTQFDYPSCEDLGLVKMDFLGLRNLTILDDALKNVQANRDVDVDLDALSKDPTDPLTYELLGRGDTLGVFQFDGGPMRSLLRLMRPDCFEDISAVGALYRPGPMGAGSHTNYALRKNGQQPITPIHPELAEPLAEILGTTHGLIVYQEQVMAIAQKLAGYTAGKADLLRRAMGKKKREVLDAEFEGFSAGMSANGYSAEAVKTLWDILVPFSDYAFNKAHSAAYGLVSYWTAYLKANYPAEYMAALLTSVRDDKSSTGKMPVYLNECRRMGIKVLPPDVNSSDANFTPIGTDIRFGLTAIRNVGANVVDAIVTAREHKGRFGSFQDFLTKVPAVVCNKRTIESLVKAGAFDELGASRRALVARHEEAVDAVIDVKRNEAIGQFDLFGSLGDGDGADGTGFSVDIPALPEWDKREKLAYERDMLGLYVSDHPLFGLEHVLSQSADASIASVLGDDSRPDGASVTIAGMVCGLQRKMTKNGNPWAIATLEDLDGTVEVLFFPQTYQTVSTVLAQDLVCVVRGRINRRDDAVTVYASELSIPDIREGPRGPVVITLPVIRCTTPVVERLKDVLATHPGVTEVHLRLTQSARETVMRLDDGLRVTPSPALFGDLKALLGSSCLV